MPVRYAACEEYFRRWGFQQEATKQAMINLLDDPSLDVREEASQLLGKHLVRPAAAINGSE